MVRHVFAAACFLCLISGNVLAQLATGVPAFGSFSGGPDIVNNANLNVHLPIPVISKAGRGLPFTYTLTYDSTVWSQYWSSGSYYWNYSNSGWAGISEASTGYISYQ